MKRVNLTAVPAVPLAGLPINESNVWKIEVDQDSIEAYMNSAPVDGKTFRELTEGLWEPSESLLHRIASKFSRAA